MTEPDDPFGSPDGFGESYTETTFARGRSPEFTYASKTFDIDRETSSDYGQPARFVQKVFDSDAETRLEFEGNEWVIYESPGGRIQVKLLVAREAGHVKELWIQRVPTAGSWGTMKVALNLKAPAVQRLIELLKSLDDIPIEGATTQRIDDSVVRQVFADPEALGSAYRQDRERFRDLIENDSTAPDVIALAHRRQEVDRFHRYIEDDAFFDEAVAAESGGGAEAVWQRFFEDNPWILGMSLSGQLLTSWDEGNLERVVAGRSVATVGKRVDALLETSGRIRSMVLQNSKPIAPDY